MDKLAEVVKSTKALVENHKGSISSAEKLAKDLEAKAREIREAVKNTARVDLSGVSDDISGDVERLAELLSDGEITMDEAREAAELASTISGNASDMETAISDAIEEAENE